MSLERFVEAQEKGGSYERALAELKAGQKTGHWIWWVFPQLNGLGTSPNSTYYGLADEHEARDYHAHPVLGARYRACVDVVHGQLGPGEVAPLTLMGGEIDVRKLRSSLELWRKVTPADNAVRRGLADNILKALG
jgi:uncharacterized protein (DUF1810 family)